MIHARPDYNRMQDPALDDPALLGEGCSPIAADEPVCLFRAQDRHFVDVLRDYKVRIGTAMGSGEMDQVEGLKIVDSIDAHIKLAMQWQVDHGCKSPDIP